MPSTIVSLKNFSYIYPQSEKMVLNNVNVEIKKGEFIGIVGPNRAGKSTLCTSLSGLIPFVLGGKYSGELTVKDIPITDENADIVSQTVGIVFQDAESQFSQETVEDEIAFGMCNLGVSRQEMQSRMKIVAKSCNLHELMKRSPYSLSGGQQQRVAVACMLALRPDVLILDETTSQLDPIGRDDVFKIAKELNKQGYTIVMVDHNIEKLAEYTSHLLVINEGNVILHGKTQEVLQQYELLHQAGIRLPQVTDAALRTISAQEKVLPIDLPSAIQFFKDEEK